MLGLVPSTEQASRNTATVPQRVKRTLRVPEKTFSRRAYQTRRRESERKVMVAVNIFILGGHPPNHNTARDTLLVVPTFEKEGAGPFGRNNHYFSLESARRLPKRKGKHVGYSSCLVQPWQALTSCMVRMASSENIAPVSLSQM